MYKKSTWSRFAATLSAFALIVFVGLSTPLHADQAVTTSVAVSSTAKLVTPHPVNFNGSWFSVANYGVQNTEGGKVAKSVAAQFKAYKDAKRERNLEGKLSNALWSSVQAWAWNNSAYVLIQRHIKAVASHVPDDKRESRLHAAKNELMEGLAVLEFAGKLPEGDNEEQTKAFAAEKSRRAEAQAMLDLNLLYVKRALGEEPWPDSKD